MTPISALSIGCSAGEGESKYHLCFASHIAILLPLVIRWNQIEGSLRLSGQHIAGNFWRPVVAANCSRHDDSRLPDVQTVPECRRGNCDEHPGQPVAETGRGGNHHSAEGDDGSKTRAIPAHREGNRPRAGAFRAARLGCAASRDRSALGHDRADGEKPGGGAGGSAQKMAGGRYESDLASVCRPRAPTRGGENSANQSVFRGKRPGRKLRDATGGIRRCA